MSSMKKVHLYDVDGNFIKTFETTKDCADYFGKDVSYINYNLKNYDKIRKNNKWYSISRDVLDTSELLENGEIKKLKLIISRLKHENKQLKEELNDIIKESTENRELLMVCLEKKNK